MVTDQTLECRDTPWGSTIAPPPQISAGGSYSYYGRRASYSYYGRRASYSYYGRCASYSYYGAARPYSYPSPSISWTPRGCHGILTFLPQP